MTKCRATCLGHCEFGVVESSTIDWENFPDRMEKFRARSDAIVHFCLEFRHALFGALIACLSAFSPHVFGQQR